MSEDRRHRRVSRKLEIRECPIIPNARWCELGLRTCSIIVVRGLLRDGTGRTAFVIGIAELDDIEGRALSLLHIEIVAAPIGIDRHIGMDAACDRLDGKGLPAGDTVNLEAFRIASNDGPDTFADPKFHRGHMGEGDVQAINLRLLVCGEPHATVIGSATWNGLSQSQAGKQRK